jgi:hypothetical protein
MCIAVKPLLFVFLAAGLGLGQTSFLQVSSATGVPGSTVPLSITLTSAGGAQPSALQWDLVTGTGVSAVSAVPGGVGLSAGKSLQCSGARCLLFGGNTNVMSNGVAVTLNVTLSPTASGNIDWHA